MNEAEVERVRRSLLAYVHYRYYWIPEDDLDDIHGQTMVELVASSRPCSEWGRLGRTIARRRAIDWIDGTTRSRDRPLPDDVAGAARIDPEEVREDARRLVEQLIAVTEANPAERLLVTLVLDHIGTEGRMPALRRIGSHPELWPARPQTACEKWASIVSRIHRE